VSAAVSFLLLTSASVAALLLAEARGSRTGVWLAKPLASVGFVALALACGAADTPYGRAVGVALGLSLAGDVLLIPQRRPGLFRAGILAFLLGHLAFVGAFAVRGLAPLPTCAAAAASALPAALLLRWLAPRLPRDLRIPVFAYVAVISLMLAAAAGSVAAAGDARILVAALGFYLSDFSVARDRFVAPGFANRLWGLPLYYAAQLLFALTAAAS